MKNENRDNRKLTLTQTEFFGSYTKSLANILLTSDFAKVAALGELIRNIWSNKKQLFLCGNGGSAGNAAHIANDLIYGVSEKTGGGIRANALSANPATITCLANDVGYKYIFSEQIAVLASAGDLLLVLSGSGESHNLVEALKQAKKMDVTTSAILGFSGGECKSLADVAVHFELYDMQQSEDLQLIIGHMLTRWLKSEGNVQD